MSKRTNVMASACFIAAACMLTPVASSQELGPGVDAGAIAELQTFLFNDVARRSFANSNPNARQANDFVESFPPWATQELLEIVMMIMRESGEGAMKHATAYSNQGAKGAKASFSPAVRARIDALVGRLQADQKFNNPANLRNMQRQMPVLPTRGS